MIGKCIFLVVATLTAGTAAVVAQTSPEPDTGTEQRVLSFLERHRTTWRDMNISDRDGRILHDIIVENNYTRALEIGTSTGRSAIWIALALHKTGGKLITLEIDESRRAEALRNFREAGVDHLIDSRLGNAHDIVPALKQPFDFVFSDADKDWYLNYFRALEDDLVPGGCFTAHNVINVRYGGMREFLDYLDGHPGFTTTIERGGGAGISVSYKKAE